MKVSRRIGQSLIQRFLVSAETWQGVVRCRWIFRETYMDYGTAILTE